jgi:hypothetical protein
MSVNKLQAPVVYNWPSEYVHWSILASISFGGHTNIAEGDLRPGFGTTCPV